MIHRQLQAYLLRKGVLLIILLIPPPPPCIQILGPNYLSALEQWIEPDNLLPLFVREGAAAAAAAAEHQHHHWRRHSSGGVVGEEAAAAARLEEAARQLEGNEGPWRDLMLYVSSSSLQRLLMGRHDPL